MLYEADIKICMTFKINKGVFNEILSLQELP